MCIICDATSWIMFHYFSHVLYYKKWINCHTIYSECISNSPSKLHIDYRSGLNAAWSVGGFHNILFPFLQKDFRCRNLKLSFFIFELSFHFWYSIQNSQKINLNRWFITWNHLNLPVFDKFMSRHPYHNYVSTLGRHRIAYLLQSILNFLWWSLVWLSHCFRKKHNFTFNNAFICCSHYSVWNTLKTLNCQEQSDPCRGNGFRICNAAFDFYLSLLCFSSWLTEFCFMFLMPTFNFCRHYTL